MVSGGFRSTNVQRDFMGLTAHGGFQQISRLEDGSVGLSKVSGEE